MRMDYKVNLFKLLMTFVSFNCSFCYLVFVFIFGFVPQALAASPWSPQTTQTLLSGLVFDWQAYLVLNPDLPQHGIDTLDKAQDHWLNYGAKEGRQANGVFAVKKYLSNYLDLSTAFKGDLKFVDGILHYVNYGKHEGRQALPVVQSYGGLLPSHSRRLGDAVIGNPLLKITTSSQYAGAINGLFYADKQFVNNYDHGRQIQISAFSYGMEGCNNPTEAGREDDLQSLTSTSILQGIIARPKSATTPESLATLTLPAYWLSPWDKPSFCPSNMDHRNQLEVATDISFWKSIELNYLNDWQMFKMKVIVNLSSAIPQFKVNPINVYLQSEFSEVLRYIPSTGNLKTVSLYPYTLETSDILGGNSAEPVILAMPGDPRKALALAILSPTSNNYQSNVAADALGSKFNGAVYPVQKTTFSNTLNPELNTVASNLQFKYSVAGPGPLEYQVVFIVGTLFEVQQKLQQKYNMLMRIP